MKGHYGVSTSTPNEAVFSCGLFECVEYSKSAFSRPDAFELLEKETEEMIALSKKYSVEIRSFHVPFGVNEFYAFKPSSLDDGERERTLDYTKRIVNIVSKAGVRYLVIHGSLRVRNEDRPKHLDVFIDYLRKLADYCKPFGISIAVETLKPRCIGNGLYEHKYIMEHVERDNVGICFDSNHLLDEDNYEFLEGVGQYIITTHLSDFDHIDEKHWFPGRGVNDWKRIASLLKEKGYKGPAVFEVSFKHKPPREEELKELITEWEQLFE